jgi:hypothetical protein
MFSTNFYGDSKLGGEHQMAMDLMDLQRRHTYFQFDRSTKSEIKPDKSFLHYPLLDFGTWPQMCSTSWNEDFPDSLEVK